MKRYPVFLLLFFTLAVYGQTGTLQNRTLQEKTLQNRTLQEKTLPNRTPQEKTLQDKSSGLKIIFTGDIMGHDSQIASALAAGGDGYDYRSCFRYLQPYFSEADLVIGNLEVTLAGPPYRGYPRFSSPDELADALLEAGFDILITANNHALDRGDDGLVRTLHQLDRRGILHTGTFSDSAGRQRYYPLLLEKNGIRIALLNYTYGTNGLKSDHPVAVNYIDTAQIREDLGKASLAEPDMVLLTLHWGTEYERLENSIQRRLARFALDHGADAVIGSHPHVVQPVKGEGKGNLVVYSLGNFISNQRPRYRNGGIAFEMELVKKSGNTRIVRHAYLPVWVHKPVTKKGTLFTLVPAAIDPDNFPELMFSPEDRMSMRQFLTDTRIHLGNVKEVEPVWIVQP
ncbi:MAG: CapA family protein [Bacteroidales bacterium]